MNELIERSLRWLQMAMTAAGLSQAEPPKAPVPPPQAPAPVAEVAAAPAPAAPPAQAAAPLIAPAPVPVKETPAASFDAMEAIVAEAPSLHAFLGSAALKARYLAALESYYGVSYDTSPNQGSYTMILEYLGKALQTWPELERILWEPVPVERFTLTPAVKSYGRKMTPESEALWIAYFHEQILEPLRRDSGRFAPLSAEELRSEIPAVKRALEERFEARKAEILASDQPKKKKAIEALHGMLLGDPEFKALGSNLVLRYLEKPAVEAALARPGQVDANTVVDVLAHLKQEYHPILEGWGAMPPNMASQVRSSLPDAKKLLARKDLFPEVMGQARDGKLIPVGETALETYVAETAPRRFHQIWETIANGECIGGGRWRHDYPGNATPRRWLTIALQGTRRYHLRAGGKYLGFVHLVGIRRKSDGKLFGAYEAFPKVMKQAFTVIDPATSLPVSKPFYELFLHELAPRLPPSWSGLVMGQSERAANHQGGMREMRDHALFRNGQVVGGPGDFEAADPDWARFLSLAEETTGIWAKDYRGIIVVDALLFDARELRALALALPSCQKALE